MKSKVPAVILAAAAIIVLGITVFVLTSKNKGDGLYVSAASGDVTIQKADGSVNALTADVYVAQSDIITTNSGSCTLVYRTKDNEKENYAIVYSDSQVYVSDEFNGKADGELFLGMGTVLVNNINPAKNNLFVRTDSVSATAKEAVICMVCADDAEGRRSTTVSSFAGRSRLQLYNNIGSPIGMDGTEGGKGELLDTGLRAGVLSGVQGGNPSFDYLNVDIDLSAFSQPALRDLITVASFHELKFTAEQLKEAYNNAAPPEEPAETETETETTTETSVTTEETTVTTTEEKSETTEEETTVTTEEETTRAPEPETTRAPATTAAPVYTTRRYTSPPETVGTVYSFDGNENSAPSYDVPEDFDPNDVGGIDDIDVGGDDLGYDDDGDELGYDDDSDLGYDDDDGGDLGYDDDDELGYDDFDVLSGGSVNAPSVPTYTVTFIVDGQYYSTKVQQGGQAVPPVTPSTSSDGLPFLGWDQVLSNVNSDMTVHALF